MIAQFNSYNFIIFEKLVKKYKGIYSFVEFFKYFFFFLYLSKTKPKWQIKTVLHDRELYFIIVNVCTKNHFIEVRKDVGSDIVNLS